MLRLPSGIRVVSARTRVADDALEFARYDAFLSYNSQDRLVVEELARWLRDQKLELFIEEWELAPGREFQPALAEGLRNSETCVVFLGPERLGAVAEAGAPGRYRQADPRRGVPRHPGAAARCRAASAGGRGGGLRVPHQRVVGRVPHDARRRTGLPEPGVGITGTKPLEPDGTRYEGVCPYRGLEAFGPDDAKFFLGRAALTGWLVSALRREVRAAQGVRLLGVLGPSGSGKASVVFAGLVLQLKAGAIEGSERWPVAILRPGDDPLKNLAAGVVPRFLPAGACPTPPRC